MVDSLGVLATYDGVDIVATPDTLSGKPRLDGHRIGVHHITSAAEVGDRTAIENVQDTYPHLATAQVEAALQFATDYEDILRTVEKRQEMIRMAMNLCRQTIVCTCGDTLYTVESYSDHVDSNERADLGSRDHKIEEKYYDGTDTVTCTCGDEFDNPFDFVAHISRWYESDDHLLDKVVRGNANSQKLTFREMVLDSSERTDLDKLYDTEKNL